MKQIIVITTPLKAMSYKCQVMACQCNNLMLLLILNISAPVQGVITPRTHQWSTRLCRCLDDPGICLVTCFCPCVTFGMIAEIVDKGNSTCTCDGTIYGALLAVTGLACLYSCYYRSKLRAQYDLPEAPCMDCLVHFCCETCALCQEYRELKNRGYDLSIGT
ncbi:putative PLAC8 motif-containing protein [Medicago truncatula]|uniref:Fruit weight 2.2 protein n=1 Tax=Medicago truncatula TaxID=3880 RepID=G7JLA2_MEDTR|nr:fruit weight 2.2 protein [Medicago truncatula]RHN62214.1 putative PLAC8 motif-containing protein [Medicago truncatula]